MHGTHLGIFTVSLTMFSENLSAASEAFAKHPHLQSQHQPPLVLLSWGVRAGATHEKSEGSTGEISMNTQMFMPQVFLVGDFLYLSRCGITLFTLQERVFLITVLYELLVSYSFL